MNYIIMMIKCKDVQFVSNVGDCKKALDMTTTTPAAFRGII